MTKVSVIIPCFNQARYLARAVESVLTQTHPDLEVIIVNDGSTDETETVAARFRSHAAFRYLAQDNRGLPAARNAGLRVATGEYLSFLDADDYLHPDKVASQVRVLEENPALGFVYCDIVSVDEAEQPLPEQYSVADARVALCGNIFFSLVRGGFFPPHTVLVRRRALVDVGEFDVGLGGHADYDMWMRLAGAGHEAYFVNRKLAYYRRYPQSMSGDASHMTESRRMALAKIAALHPERFGAAVARLQDHTQELYESNRWLRDRWEDVLAKATDERVDDEGRESFSFVHRFKRGQLISGNPDQAAIWEADLGNEPARAIYLQPPARLKFAIPGGEHGRLVFAVAMHPDCWSNPSSGGCQFIALIDGAVAVMAHVDPTQREADRRWHRFEVDVPASETGAHEVILETKTVGPTADFRWALWREPRFTPRAHEKANASRARADQLARPE
jgi:glycosyltransferase involved in cell wall biosynthesis